MELKTKIKLTFVLQKHIKRVYAYKVIQQHFDNMCINVKRMYI